MNKAEVCRLCVLCGISVSKSELSAHNRFKHGILSFKWDNNNVKLLLSSDTVDSRIHPPVKTVSVTNVTKPTPPVAVTTSSGKYLPSDCFEDSNSNEYDMDISASSQSDSDIDGDNLFGDQAGKYSTKKNKGEAKGVGAENSLPHQPPRSIDDQAQHEFHVRDMVESVPSPSDERPTLSAQVEDNFFELILTTRVYSKSNSEYGTFPVRSKLKPKYTKAETKKKRKRHSSMSSVSSTGTEERDRRLHITNADLTKLFEQQLLHTDDNGLNWTEL